MSTPTFCLSRCTTLTLLLLLVLLPQPSPVLAADDLLPPPNKDYIFTIVGLTANGNTRTPEQSLLNFDVMEVANDFWSVGVCTIYKDGFNTPPDAFFYMPVGLFFPIKRFHFGPGPDDLKGLLSVRARLFTIDGMNRGAGFYPKAYQLSLAYDDALLWGADLTWSGVFEKHRPHYNYLEGLFLRFTIRLGTTVWF